ncbi:hypothetical protein C3L33_03353, partial [Rhododendron williamsianum]
MVLALLHESDLVLLDDDVELIVDKTFNDADAKGDGQIDQEEWKEFVSNNPSLIKNMTLPYLMDLTLAFPSFVVSTEVDTMLKREDLQLLQDSEVDTTIVLVANQSSPSQMSVSGRSQQSSITPQPPGLHQHSCLLANHSFGHNKTCHTKALTLLNLVAFLVNTCHNNIFLFLPDLLPGEEVEDLVCLVISVEEAITLLLIVTINLSNLLTTTTYNGGLLIPLLHGFLLMYHIQGNLDLSQANRLQVIHFQGFLRINQGNLLSTDSLDLAQALQGFLMVLEDNLCHHRHILLILLELFRGFPLLIP